jgi:hypothetical protein
LPRRGRHETSISPGENRWSAERPTFNCGRSSRKRATARFGVALEAHELR